MDGKAVMKVLSRGDDNLETCAMHLEVTRLSRHLRTISGSYQGKLLFIDAQQVLAFQTPESARYNVFTAAQRQDLDDKIADLLKSGQGG